MSNLKSVIGLLGVLWAVGIVSTVCKADVIDDVVLEAGLTYSIYEEDTKSGNIFSSADHDKNGVSSFQIRGGYKPIPVYGVFGYEKFHPGMMGQNNGKVDGLSVGLGFRHNWEAFNVFVEGGYTFVDWEQGTDSNHREITYTRLVGNHNVYSRPVPVNPYDYNWEYEVDDAPYLRVGIEYQLWSHVKVGASYRWLKPDEHVAIWDTYRRENDLGYWREDTTTDYSSVEASIWWTL